MNIQKITRNKLVEHFDYDAKKDIGYCEPCVGGKHHRSPFDSRKSQTAEIQKLVHSDVCGKMGEEFKGGANYFLTFVDDKSRHTRMYPMNTKDQVFDR